MSTHLEVKEVLEGVNKGLVDLQKKIDERDDQIRKLGVADSAITENIKQMQIALDAKEEKHNALKAELETEKKKVEALELQVKDRRPHAGGATEEKFDIARAIRGLSLKEWDRDLEKKLLCRRDDRTNLRGKALIDETGNSGGHYLIPDEFITEVIPLLYNASVFGSLPVRRLNPSGGTVKMPKMTSGATSYMVGAASAITASNSAFTQADMTPHKVGTLVPIDNALVRRSDPAVGEIVRQDMMKSAGLKSEYQFIYGDGQAPNLTGIYNASISSKSMGDNGAKFSAANNIDNLMYVIREVENQNAVFEAWVFNTRTKWDLRTVKTSQGDYILTLANNAGDPPMLLGYPYFTTNQIPNNITQGQNADTTFLLGGQWSDIIVAVWTNMEISASTEATFVDGEGTTIPAYQYDLTLMRLIHEIDILLRHPLGMCRLIGIRANDAT